MSSGSVPTRRPPVRVNAEQYEKLRLGVLNRDGWRCQSCGSMTNLDVHHARRRSDLGDDAQENLITLCRRCHRIAHGHLRELEMDSGTIKAPETNDGGSF